MRGPGPGCLASPGEGRGGRGDQAWFRSQIAMEMPHEEEQFYSRNLDEEPRIRWGSVVDLEYWIK